MSAGGSVLIKEGLDSASQFLIFILGAMAIFMVSLPAVNPWQRYGYIVGLLSQPAWFYTSIYHRQIGVFLVSVVFTGSWVFGILVRF